MDLPIILDGNATFAMGVEELRQSLYLLLKEPIMTWYQSCRVGSRIVLHSSDVMELKLEVQDTLKQLNGVEVVNVDVVGNRVTIQMNYNGRELEESFDVQK